MDPEYTSPSRRSRSLSLLSPGETRVPSSSMRKIRKIQEIRSSSYRDYPYLNLIATYSFAFLISQIKFELQNWLIIND